MYPVNGFLTAGNRIARGLRRCESARSHELRAQLRAQNARAVPRHPGRRLPYAIRFINYIMSDLRMLCTDDS